MARLLLLAALPLLLLLLLPTNTAMATATTRTTNNDGNHATGQQQHEQQVVVAPHAVPLKKLGGFGRGGTAVDQTAIAAVGSPIGSGGDSGDMEEGSDDEVDFYGLERARVDVDSELQTNNNTNIHHLATERRNLNEKLSTIAISTFLLELTIQRQSTRNLSSDSDSNTDSNHHLRHNPSSPRHLQKDKDTPTTTETITPIDDIIQSLAQDHLSAIYSDAFDNVPNPSQVLLTVITTDNNNNNNNNNNDDGSSSSKKGNTIYIRQSFVGGVVSFPADSSDTPSHAELERVTLEAFEIPGLGEEFLTALREREHPDLKGLLLLGAREVNRGEGGTGGGNNAGSAGTMTTTTTTTSGGTNVVGNNGYGYVPSPNESSGTTESLNDNNNNGGMNNIWAIAAVAALGAMFVTIILCTSILYCDWRKRKERRNHKRHASRQNGKSSVNGSLIEDRSNLSDGFSGMNSNSYTNNNNNNSVEALRIVVPADSGETDDQTPSPSTQGSDDHVVNTNSMMMMYSNNNNNNNNTNATFIPNNQNNGNTVGRGSITGKMSNIVNKSRPKHASRAASAGVLAQPRPKNASRTASVGRIALPILTKSKSIAANAELQQSAGPVEDDAYVPRVAPSVEYSVGEDTTMLYPNMNRGRKGSRDDVSDGEFDGYSVDAASTLDYDTPGMNRGGSGSRTSGSGVKESRDFDSVWDDESKMTASVMDGGHGEMGGMDDDTYAGISVGDGGPIPAPQVTMEMDDPNKANYGDLSQSLNQLVEHQYGEKSPDSSKNVNLYELDSASDSGSSNRGAFTLELLGNNKSSKGRKALDDDDSILGDMYSQDGTMSQAEDDSIVGEGKVPSSADSVDSTPSWAAPIQSALLRSNHAEKAANATNGDGPDSSQIFRAPASSSITLSPMVESPSDDDASSKQSQERINDKFVSSLSKNNDSDDRSISSNRSSRSNRSSGSSKSNRSANTRGSSSDAVAATNNRASSALGTSRSEDHEEDDDPEEMIESINNMLSECRVILDTDKQSEC